MFEFSVACKYLRPRRRQLSVSVISLVAISVIAVVAWLVVVFFSVSEGLEQSWIRKLTALTAPLRITPTEGYYQSYYYQIDALSDASNYTLQSIEQKRLSSLTDPYNIEIDQEIPDNWPSADLNAQGKLKDLVKLAYQALTEVNDIAGLQAHDFELTPTHIRLNMIRPATLLHGADMHNTRTTSSVSYPAYLGNFDPHNTQIKQTLLPVEINDINNFFNLLDLAPSASSNEKTTHLFFNQTILQDRIKDFLQNISITHLKVSPAGWNIPKNILPDSFNWKVCFIMKDNRIIRVMIPENESELNSLFNTLETQGLKIVRGFLHKKENAISALLANQPPQTLTANTPLTLTEGGRFAAKFEMHSLNKIHQINELIFQLSLNIQNTPLSGKVRFQGLQIADADIEPSAQDLLWLSNTNNVNNDTLILPQDKQIGEGIILPKSFRTVGVMMGDRGTLNYIESTASTIQEQFIPIYVAGFYDPGIIPIGSKFLLGSPTLTSLIRSSYGSSINEQAGLTNGINVRFRDLEQAHKLKHILQKKFEEKGIARYWKIETFRDYEFAHEIMQELQNQKTIFMLIALIIILVACSNIVSMLIILVNDKKKEIGILRAMGASSYSIALIFGSAGACIGIVGSFLGITLAIFTLHHLDSFLALISIISGQTLINPALYYTKTLAPTLSPSALAFVFIATLAISLLAGIVPAIKACSLRPSNILKTGSD